MPSSRLTRICGALLTAVVCACDVPTELPKWDTTFVVPAEGTTFSVGQILPSSVVVASGGNAFSVSVSPATFTETLATLCPQCVNGVPAPKPAFTGTFSTQIALPADVTGATLTSGTITIAATNGFAFDPLRPSSTARGTMTITVRNGTTVIGSTTVSGTTTAWPAGSTLNTAVPLAAGSIAGPLDVTVTLDSPAGDVTTANTNARITVTATPTNLLVSSAQVRVQNRQLTAAQVHLDFSGVDDFVVNHVKGGSLLLTIVNPFNVTSNANALTLTINAAGTTIQKQFTLAAGTSTVEIAFTEAELRLILGNDVTMSISGPVNSAQPITVTPAQVLSVSSKLKLILGPEN